MQLIEAALAFAITMLALSLVVSSFVEILHRICSMREEGLKHVLRQMFDQVLAEHVESADPAEAAGGKPPKRHVMPLSRKSAPTAHRWARVRTRSRQIKLNMPVARRARLVVGSTGWPISGSAWFIFGSTRFVFGTAARSPR